MVKVTIIACIVNPVTIVIGINMLKIVTITTDIAKMVIRQRFHNSAATYPPNGHCDIVCTFMLALLAGEYELGKNSWVVTVFHGYKLSLVECYSMIGLVDHYIFPVALSCMVSKVMLMWPRDDSCRLYGPYGCFILRGYHMCGRFVVKLALFAD